MDYTSTDKNTKLKKIDSKTAVLYIRVSSQDQVSNFSIPTQLKECREYLSKNGITEVGVFIEKGESAKSANRTEFQNLLTFLKNNKNKIDYLICYKLDRFSRNTEDFYYYKSTIGKYGTKIKSVTENIEDSSTGRFLELIYAGIAQLDNENKGERVKHCLVTKALDGWYPSVSPYGYKNDKETHRLVKDDRYFKHIQYCLKEFAKGQNTSDLAEELKRRNVKTLGRRHSESKYFTAKMLWKILVKSKFYAGVFDWKEHKDINGKHEKMITWNEHLKIQEKLHIKPSKIVRDENDLFVLNFTVEKGLGFLHCTNCGQRMRSCTSRGNGGAYRYYYCPNRPCLQRKKSVVQGTLEGALVEGLRELTPKPKVVSLFKEIMQEEWNSKLQNKDEISKDIQVKLKHLEKEKQDTISMRRRNELELDDYNNEMNKIKTEIKNLSSNIQDDEVSEVQFKKLLDNAEYFLKNIEPLYNTFPISKKRELLQIIYPKGVEYGNGKYRTKEKSYIFNVLDSLSTGKYESMGVQGLEP